MKIHRNITIFEQDLIIYRQVFEGAQALRYLGTLMIKKNVVSEETESRIAAGNRYCYSLGQIFTS